MKVLFAVNNENISESIIKKYQQEYKEIISVKNVYYFNAIIKELQRDKTYDRIVISEDLQPFSNNNYEQIDKFIFEKMDSISDEATNQSGADIPIILICTDRREKSEPLLIKLFGIGLYDALIGKDRSITNVCELLAKPRTKKEAKIYYRIDSEDVDYKVENEGDVSEVEIQNIVSYYKKMGVNEQEYVNTFDHLATQYTDAQLKLIANFLPLNVKAALEANSLKYQEVVSFGANNKINETKKITPSSSTKNVKKSIKPKEEPKQEDVNFDLIEQNLRQNRMKEPVVIPNAINTTQVKKMQESGANNMQAPNIERKQNINQQANIQMPQSNMKNGVSVNNMQTNSVPNNNTQNNIQNQAKETIKVQPQQIQEIDDILENLSTTLNEENVQKVEKKPAKTKVGEKVTNQEEQEVPKRRGRPKKVQVETETVEEKPKKGRGRPKKSSQETVGGVQSTIQENNENIVQSAPVNLFELGEDEITANVPSQTSSENDMILPGLDEELLFAEQIAEQGMPNISMPDSEKAKKDKKNQLKDFKINMQKEKIIEPEIQDSLEEMNQVIEPVVEVQEQIQNEPEAIETEEANIVEEVNISENNTNQNFEDMQNYNQEAQNYNEMAQNNYNNEQQNIYNNEQQNNYYNESQNDYNVQNQLNYNANVNNAPIIPNNYANAYTGMNQNAFNQNNIQNVNNYNMTNNLSNLLTSDKKIVAFVGTSKNGTSFLVNNLAELLSQKGINTAVLDLTKNRNAYYIYTENEEEIRKTAYECIDNLRRGNANGIKVHKNLTVYTTLPGEENEIDDYGHILETLVQNYSLVLLDCDFETNYGYFKEAQELYLVQSLDVLTIQPLTAFLRNLKSKDALEPEKIRIVLNKVVKLRSISDKTIIGGMAYYNDPAMSFMTELFNKDTVTYCNIPFEEQAYAKYLEGLVNCKISLNGYSKNFMAILNKLGDMVYPLINNTKNKGKNNYNDYSSRNNFPNDMNSTLNRMKNNY